MLTSRTPVFYAPDDEGGGPDAGVDTSSAALADARSAFLNSPPEIISSADPEPTVETDDLDDPSLGELSAHAPAPQEPLAEGSGAADPFAAYGGEEAIKEAAALQRAMTTESGVRLVVAQSLQALGYTADQIRAALAGGAQVPGYEAPAPEPADQWNIDDEEIVTGADLKRIIAQVSQQAAEQATAAAQSAVEPQQAAYEQQRQSAAAVASQATYDELLGAAPTTPEEAQIRAAQQGRLAQLSSQYIGADDWSAEGIRAAILRGHADYVNEQEAILKGYVAKKRADRNAQPTNMGGGTTPGGEAQKEPQTLAEARQQAQAAGFFT